MSNLASVAVVIPAWNEETTIGAVIVETRHVLDRKQRAAEIIVVDNGSSDATASVASSCGAHVVQEPRRGYGQACLAGIAAARADVLLFMDGDGSDDPNEIESLIGPIETDSADLVIGSREMGVSELGAHPWHAVYGTRICVLLMNALIGTKATDLGPFRAIRSASLHALNMADASFAWTVEMQIKAQRARLRALEVPANYRRRRGGDSKISGSPIASVRAGTKIVSFILSHALWPRQA